MTQPPTQPNTLGLLHLFCKSAKGGQTSPRPLCSFWCHPEWMAVHMASVTAMFGVVAGVQFAPEFGKEKYFWLRVALICAWLAYGVGLALHFIHVLGGWENPLLQAAVPR